jgi:DNA-binding response OmpR family regulator
MTFEADSRDMSQALAEVWSEHRDDAFERLEVLEEAVAKVAGGALAPEEHDAARRAAHKLRGSLGMFGYARAGEIAGELEDIFEAGIQAAGGAPRLAALVLELRDRLEADPSSDPASKFPLQPSRRDARLVTSDPDLARVLAQAAASYGFRIRAVSHSDSVGSLQSGGAVLLDAGAEAGGKGLSETVARRVEEAGGVPVLVLAPSGALVDRVAATRVGARGFIRRDLPPEEILKAAGRLLTSPDERTPTVLLVDDDPALLAAASTMLTARGFEPVVLDDPARFWERLEEVEPDIAVIDLDMPRISGVDLCRALRSDPRWVSLPIVILTALRGRGFVNEAFAAGADDFVSKPVDEDELVLRLENRLARVRSVENAERAVAFGDQKTAAQEMERAGADVVVVEDDPGVSDVLQSALDSMGLTSEHYDDGVDALAALAGEERLSPKVAILDWDLPGTDGLSVLRAMRDSGALNDTRVVMLTARATEEETLKALDIGAFDFVAKPFSVPILVERVNRALGR